jgi:hypothetical protein
MPAQTAQPHIEQCQRRETAVEQHGIGCNKLSPTNKPVESGRTILLGSIAESGVCAWHTGALSPDRGFKEGRAKVSMEARLARAHSRA